MGERIPISMSEAVEGWLADCALSGMSRDTIKNYRSGTRNVTVAYVTDFTPTLARELMAAKINRGLALSSCKTFYGRGPLSSVWPDKAHATAQREEP